MAQTALISGITGQDGSYLAELLLEKGYVVHGLVRRSSSLNTARLDSIYQEPQASERRLILHYGDLLDAGGLDRLVREIHPDEVYNLGAQSHVRVSFDTPSYTAHATGLGAINLLEAVRSLGEGTRFIQASSSEMFGSTPPPQHEGTPFYPRSPYAVAKLFSYWSAVNAREAYGTFAANAIMFNHESPRRGTTFVTRKITRAVARIEKGLQKELFLGNLDASRDWGYAPEYVEGMWRMLQLDRPTDLVLSTGEEHTVREFCVAAFAHAGLNWEQFVRFDPRYERASEVDALRGDSTRAAREIGWSPKVGFDDLVRIMVDADMKQLSDELAGRLTQIDRD